MSNYHKMILDRVISILSFFERVSFRYYILTIVCTSIIFSPGVFGFPSWCPFWRRRLSCINVSLFVVASSCFAPRCGDGSVSIHLATGLFNCCSIW
ncbi:hypothetical protein BU24DRAFT_279525 [Aaosphaeria arxii CBS 175.79]|uniref:Uncharacterized protein n=1 Tax=Aaosphaeria arxii CBS 175.79 TaxID=1450172 RepID=A0A6A5XES6_9PLEO|nr:uncharacterized protein BU24DRAFT_279525 [Aaosphaeria arxii CBS 175.79]KAF2011351.1 hypothetical protein BU24DRAFT_279525 [Aaosphaeria arxii CBS 175.79]